MSLEHSTPDAVADTAGAATAPAGTAPPSPTAVDRSATRTTRSGRWVAILATTVVATVAATVSYDHMRTLADRAGESWKSSLIPLAIDGMVVAASTVLLARRRAGEPGGVLAWLALLGGVLVSLAANAAAAQPTVVGRAIALVPPLALAVSFELVRSLVSAGSQASPGTPPGNHHGDGGTHQAAPATLEQRATTLLAEGHRNGQPVGRGRLARELEISEHQARQLLDRLKANRPS